MQVEYIVEHAVVFVGPQMVAGRGIDELDSDPQPAASLAHAPFQYVAHAKLAPDLAHIGRVAFVGEARIARDHEEPFQSRQPSDDVFHNAVGEVFLLVAAAHVLKG